MTSQNEQSIRRSLVSDYAPHGPRKLLELGRVSARKITSNPALEAGLHSLVRRHLLPRVVWSRMPVEHEFRVRINSAASFLYDSIAGDILGRLFFWGGIKAWEYETTSVFMDLCANARVVLDIGANTGIFTLLACAVNGGLRVVSFEPQPQSFSRLIRNLEINGFDSRCESFESAVSDFDGEAAFHVPFGEVPGSCSLDPEGFCGLPGELIRVAVTSIDTAVPAGTKVDLAKIDVENFEDHVLMGMARVLAESKPALVIECLPFGPYKKIQNILSEFGYRFFHLRPEGPVRMPEIIPDESMRFRNFLCQA